MNTFLEADYSICHTMVHHFLYRRRKEQMKSAPSPGLVNIGLGATLALEDVLAHYL